MATQLEIIYRDDYLVAINKPHGLLVHRSSMAADAEEFALQRLRDQLGCKVYLVHRLDRKTSGVLLFSFSSEVNAAVGKAFAERRVDKTYIAIVRGWFPEGEVVVDYPLTNDKGKEQDAVTTFRAIRRIELPIPLGLHSTSRYTLISAHPQTGRMHQIRKHLNHLRHPILGDRPHGCSKQNRLWKERYGMTQMMLHASELSLEHPVTGLPIVLSAEPSSEMRAIAKEMRLEL